MGVRPGEKRIGVDMSRRFLLLLASSWILASAGVYAGDPSSGELAISRTNGLYSIETHNVPLSAILNRINEIENGVLKFLDPPERTVNCRYQDMELNELLDRLRVSFVLLYERDPQDGAYRITEGSLYGTARPILTPEQEKRVRDAIRNLRDDKIPGNATRAKDELCEMGCAIVDLLEPQLYSDDYQTRHLVALVLRGCCPDYHPSDRLLELTLDRLRPDTSHQHDFYLLAWQGEPFEYLRDASNAYPRIRDRLIRNLGSEDRNERLRSALLLAEHGESGYVSVLANMLIPHLADNRLSDDGCLAAYALYRLGEPVRPYITALVDSADDQQADLAELILHQLDNPGSTNGRLRNPMINTYKPNPVIQRPSMTSGYYWSDDRFPDENGEYTVEDRPAYAEDVSRPEQTDFNDPSATHSMQPMNYTVQEGDTVSSICMLFIVRVEDFLLLNPGLNTNTPPQPGLKVLIPYTL